jgi:hypothetical protein
MPRTRVCSISSAFGTDGMSDPRFGLRCGEVLIQSKAERGSTELTPTANPIKHAAFAAGVSSNQRRFDTITRRNDIARPRDFCTVECRINITPTDGEHAWEPIYYERMKLL